MFSLGSRAYAFAYDVFARKPVFDSVFARLSCLRYMDASLLVNVFSPGKRVFDFATFSLSNCNFDFVSHVFAQESHFRISERRYNTVIAFKAKFSFCEERIRSIKVFLP